MIRLFLMDQLRKAGLIRQKKVQNDSSSNSMKRNRRAFDRFSVDHKHLTMMNEQDILLIRDVSAKGFSSVVSKRTWDRFEVGDVFKARMRYLMQLYDLTARVSWKSAADVVGFELVDASQETFSLLKRLISPLERGSSLRKVDSSFTRSDSHKKMWFHGDKDTDVYLWYSDSDELEAWQIQVGEKVIEWRRPDQLRTGKMNQNPESTVLEFSGTAMQLKHDEIMDAQVKQYAIDLMMGSPDELKDEILPTLWEVA